ncbi:MAG: membrane protein insertion efficiency factor YidD [Candidatus Nanopelagicales bacterium]
MTAPRQAWTAARRAWDMTLGRLMVAVLVAAIHGYQRFVSPLFGPTCRYYPSCSAYALGAVRTHGAVKGSLLASARLVRCNPWSPGGIDHVPAKGSWRGGKDVRPTAERVGS